MDTKASTASAGGSAASPIAPIVRAVPVGEKPCLSLVITGHVDVGKSTLLGHFLVQVGVVQQKTIRKFETESKSIGKASFAYAWVLDQNESEVCCSPLLSL